MVNSVSLRRSKSISSEDELRLCKEYQDDTTSTLTTLGSKFGVSTSTVGNIISHYGIKRKKWSNGRKGAFSVPENAQSEICDEYLRGKTTTFLAGKHKTSPANIHAILQRRGIETRKRGSNSGSFSARKLSELEASAVSMWQSGETFEKIAEIFPREFDAILALVWGGVDSDDRFEGALLYVMSRSARKLQYSEWKSLCQSAWASNKATKPTLRGPCEICKANGSLVVDHNHDTDEIRGLLCSGCNTGLGKLGDTVDSLILAINYLKGST
jgi:hypothetical protein